MVYISWFSCSVRFGGRKIREKTYKMKKRKRRGYALLVYKILLIIETTLDTNNFIIYKRISKLI